jgi:hypothetical protein
MRKIRDSSNRKQSSPQLVNGGQRGSRKSPCSTAAATVERCARTESNVVNLIHHARKRRFPHTGWPCVPKRRATPPPASSASWGAPPRWPHTSSHSQVDTNSTAMATLKARYATVRNRGALSALALQAKGRLCTPNALAPVSVDLTRHVDGVGLMHRWSPTTPNAEYHRPHKAATAARLKPTLQRDALQRTASFPKR